MVILPVVALLLELAVKAHPRLYRDEYPALNTSQNSSSYLRESPPVLTLSCLGSRLRVVRLDTRAPPV